MSNKKLGKFGHHPDPATDFCVEVEELEGMAYNRKVGFCAEPDFDKRLEAALDFKVGGDPCAVSAKHRLRKLEPSPASRAATATGKCINVPPGPQPYPVGAGGVGVAATAGEEKFLPRVWIDTEFVGKGGQRPVLRGWKEPFPRLAESQEYLSVSEHASATKGLRERLEMGVAILEGWKPYFKPDKDIKEGLRATLREILGELKNG